MGCSPLAPRTSRVIGGSFLSHMLVKTYYLEFHVLDAQLDCSVNLSWQCHVDMILTYICTSILYGTTELVICIRQVNFCSKGELCYECRTGSNMSLLTICHCTLVCI